MGKLESAWLDAEIAKDAKRPPAGAVTATEYLRRIIAAGAARVGERTAAMRLASIPGIKSGLYYNPVSKRSERYYWK